jgi:hypothetical protein
VVLERVVAVRRLTEEEDAAGLRLPPQLRHEHQSLRGQDVLVDGAQEDESNVPNCG